MAIDTTPYEFHEHPRSALRFAALGVLVLLAFALAAAFPGRSGPAHHACCGSGDPRSTKSGVRGRGDPRG